MPAAVELFLFPPQNSSLFPRLILSPWRCVPEPRWSTAILLAKNISTLPTHMEQIIKALAIKFNLPESSVRSALGVILNFVKQKSGGTGFEQFAARIPGTTQLASSPPPADDSAASGLLGGIISRAGGMLGGNLGSAAEVVGQLQKVGIPLDKAAPMAREFLAQARAVAGEDTVASLLKSVPELQSFLKTGEKEVDPEPAI